MSSEPCISLCMIVKNEQHCIRRCLDSVKQIVDEMIIVDTGSKDQTIDICEEYGAKLFSFAWNGDFSAARNYSLKQASGNWILFLDADEALDEKDRVHLKSMLDTSNYDVFSLPIINYYGEAFDLDKAAQYSQYRIFRNNMGLHFVNSIHETLNIHEILTDETRKGLLNVRIHHIGYLDSEVEQKQKFKRNTGYLEKELEKADSEWIRFSLAAEYTRAGQFEKAYEHINASILLFLKAGRVPQSEIYKWKYNILIQMERWDEAHEGIRRALLIYPDYVDLWFYLGYILLQQSKFQEALQPFEICLGLGDGNPKYYTEKGVGSFRALYYKGVCLNRLGDAEAAKVCFEKAVDLSPRYAEAIDALSKVAPQQS